MGLTYGQYANKLPLGVHNWAQADRYSVAVRYLDHYNFLEARTHNLSTIDARVGVEFPIVQYISARISGIVGPTFLPVIYRSINLFLLIIGFTRFVRSWNIPSVQKVIIGATLFFSPLLYFYAFNFLPDTSGLAFLLIAFGYFIDFSHTKQLKFGLRSLVFAGIATLIKTTCGIYFLAISGTVFLQYIKPFAISQLLKLAGTVLLIIGIIWSYDYYFFHKVNEDFYSRIFMSKQQPLNSFQDFQGFIKGLTYWHGQYLTWPQTVLILICVLLTIVYRRKTKQNSIGWRLVIIASLGLLLFFKLMGAQFINHDYYFIAAVLPLLFLILWLSYTALQNTELAQHKWVSIALALFMLSTGYLSVTDYHKRMNSHFVWKHRDIITDIEWMQNGNEILTDIGIPSTDIIFVGYDAAPNTSLVYFNRLGKAFNHEEMTRDSSNMKYWSERIQPDYYIFPTEWASTLSTDQPWLFGQLVLFAKRPTFLVYKPIQSSN